MTHYISGNSASGNSLRLVAAIDYVKGSVNTAAVSVSHILVSLTVL